PSTSAHRPRRRTACINEPVLRAVSLLLLTLLLSGVAIPAVRTHGNGGSVVPVSRCSCLAQPLRRAMPRGPPAVGADHRLSYTDGWRHAVAGEQQAEAELSARPGNRPEGRRWIAETTLPWRRIRERSTGHHMTRNGS